MRTYKVTITETLEKVVYVDARDKTEAEQIVCDSWHNSEYILDSDDFARVNFAAVLPERKRESNER